MCIQLSINICDSFEIDKYERLILTYLTEIMVKSNQSNQLEMIVKNVMKMKNTLL